MESAIRLLTGARLPKQPEAEPPLDGTPLPVPGLGYHLKSGGLG